MRIPLAMPCLGALEHSCVTDAIASGWISGSGPYVKSFEDALCGQLHREHVVAVASGTVALEIALQALGIGPGDEVIVPALTFAAPAAAVRSAGANVVLADVTRETWTVDPLEIARLVTGRTKAIIAVDILGHPCDFDALTDLGIPVIEDAAQAHGSRYKNRPTGGFGLISTFSFHANKCISTGEGGCIATDDGDLAARIRLIVNHGMTAERPYYHEVIGRNARMTNLTAAVGVAQVARWQELTEARRAVGDLYRRRLSSIGCQSRPEAGWASVVPWLQTVTLTGRDAVVAMMRDTGIDARAIWPALSDLPLYHPSARRPCPVATAVAATTAWLPTWAYMGERQVGEVVDALARALSESN